MQIKACSKHVYDLREFPRTLATDLDLVCDLDSRRRFLGSVMMSGLLLGSILGGRLGDRIGRKRCMFVGLAFIGPSLIAAAFAKVKIFNLAHKKTTFKNRYLYSLLRCTLASN